MSHASRILKDKSAAEEIVQDALVRVILAAPELSSTQHALAYMHKTIENLCIDKFRLEGRRPNLVLLDEFTVEVEQVWNQTEAGLDEQVSKAEDAAIVRQALALLSPAERAALVLWEIEGRSTEEIAAELGIKNSTVRHTVSRARASLRRALSALIVDDSRGLTALDILSTTYRRADKVVRKSSKSIMALFLVMFAFLGLNSLPQTSNVVSISEDGKVDDSVPLKVEVTREQVVASSNSEPPIKKITNSKSEILRADLKSAGFVFPGLDPLGHPSGFTIADSKGRSGSLYVSSKPSENQIMELSVGNILKTDASAANVLISQQIISDSSGFRYHPFVSYARAGNWVPLVIQVSPVRAERLLSGNYLLSVDLQVESEAESSMVIPATAGGVDLTEAPQRLLVKVVLNQEKTLVLAQAVFVYEKGVN
jgi:RNA polymerase sigma factor (sigma-70 family)